MNNEPIVWINLDRLKDEALYLADCVSKAKVEFAGITTPLYTHPAKTLTDEEIEECWKQTVKQEFISKVYRFDFAKAILRKAQEK
jgi:hypothetical protein